MNNYSVVKIFMERRTGLEPATISLENWDSTIELPPQSFCCQLFYYIMKDHNVFSFAPRLRVERSTLSLEDSAGHPALEAKFIKDSLFCQLCYLVPPVGVEPTSLKTEEFETSAYASSARAACN